MSNKYPENWIERRMKVFRRDEFTCQMCGRHYSEVPMDVDHITPLGDGGDNSYDNLQTLCVNCHYMKKHKGGRTPKHAFMRSIGRINPHRFTDTGMVIEELERIIGEGAVSYYGPKYELESFIKDAVPWSDSSYSPDYEYSAQVPKETVERKYLLSGKSMSADDIANEFDMSLRDAELIIEDLSYDG